MRSLGGYAGNEWDVMLNHKTWQHSIALLLFTVFLQILSIWNIELSGRDSPRVAGIAREMAVTSDYLNARLNGEKFLEYPPLGYWPIAFILSMSQKPSGFLALMPVVILGTGTVLITFLIGRALAGEKIGLMAGFILSTISGFISLHRNCTVDAALLFFIVLSLYALVAGWRPPLKSSLLLVFYLAVAGAFLSKGIIGLAIPAVTAGAFLLIQKDFSSIKGLLLTPRIFFFLMPILLWFGIAGWSGDLDVFQEVIRQSFFRFFSSSADHAKSFYFYFIPAFLHLMPWVFLLPLLLYYRRVPQPHRGLFRFALVWFLTVFIGLTLASAKRPLYLGPIYPPFALLAALGWDRVREKFPGVKRGERYGLAVMFLLYVGIYLFFVIPSENERSFRPVFEAVLTQRTHGPVYLVNPSETVRGASFFYLGKRTPVLKGRDLLLGRVGDQPDSIFVINSREGDRQLFSYLGSKGYRPLSQKMSGKNEMICAYSNASDPFSSGLK